jgi:hypothetical protein
VTKSQSEVTRGRPGRRSPPKVKSSPQHSPERPRRRRRVHNWRWPVLPLASIGLVLAVAAGLIVAATLTSGEASATGTETQAPPAVVTDVTTLPPRVLSRIGVGNEITPLQPVSAGAPLSIDGKPGVVFVSEESCPFCAAERWAVVIALSHLGTWSHLGSTTSSSTDVYPSTATFSFRDASYSSRYLALRTTELTDNAGHPLQPLTPLDTSLLDRYDVPPYVNSADQSGAVPFLDIDNRYVLAGAQYDPQVLAGLSIRQIAAQLDNPASPVAKAVDGSANVLIAAIEHLLHTTRINAGGEHSSTTP